MKFILWQIDKKEEIPESLIRKIVKVELLGTYYPEEYGGGLFQGISSEKNLS